MTLLQALILGIVQGLTEFLPISSSGHLVLVPAVLGWEIPKDQSFVFDVLVQVGTLVAVFAYFWSDLATVFTAMVDGIRRKMPFTSEDARLGWWIVIATLPAGFIGLLIKDQVEAAFASARITAGFLLLTAVLLVLAERLGRGEMSPEKMKWTDAVIIGFFQVLAIFPGVSRSGSTITGGMLRGLSRSQSARFSFLMAVPIMLAAGLLSIFDLLEVNNLEGFLPSLVTGFITSAITGYLAIRWLVGYLKKGSLYGFAVYVTVVSFAVLILAS